MTKKNSAAVTLATVPKVSLLEPDVSPEQLGQLCQIARIADLEHSAPVLAAMGGDELNRAELSVLRAGAYFLRLKEVAGHGGFLPALEAAGVSPDKAQRSMQIARFVAKLPADEARRIATLPQTRILPLVNAEPEVIAELLADGALDGDEPLSVRELRQRLKAAQRAAVDAETRLKARDVEAQRAAELAGRASPAIDKRYAALRDRGMHLVQRITHELVLLRDLVQAELVDGYSPKNDDAADRRAVVSLLYHGLGGAMVVTNEIRSAVSNTYSTNVTGTLLAEHRYRAAEALDLRQLAEAACTAAEADDATAKVKARKDHKLVGRHG